MTMAVTAWMVMKAKIVSGKLTSVTPTLASMEEHVL